MNSEIKKKIKKPKKPKSTKPTKKGKSKDKSVKQLVNVNVTSSGGGGSGGSSVPSAQPSYNPFMYQSSQAEKEANKGLLRSLEQLTKKQDDISALVKSLEKKPEDIMIKQEIQQELNNEEEIQNDINQDIFDSINEQLEADRMAYESQVESSSSIAEDEKVLKESLRAEIRRLGGKVNNRSSVEFLKKQLQGLQKE
jgi:hypothetical protein